MRLPLLVYAPFIVALVSIDEVDKLGRQYHPPHSPSHQFWFPIFHPFCHKIEDG
jgi:hypothetical protein